MADCRQEEEFKRELLESTYLEVETIDALIEMGFRQVEALRFLPKRHVMNMECVSLAQRYILIGEIKEKFKNSGRNKPMDTSCSEDQKCGERTKATKSSSQGRYKSNEEPDEDSAGNEYEQARSDVNAETWKGHRTNQSDTYQPRKSSKKTPEKKSKSTTNSTNQYHRTSRPKNSDSHQEPEIEEIQRSPPKYHVSSSDDEKDSCEVAKKHFTKRDYRAMENVLTAMDEATRSARGRIRFAAMLLNLDFPEVYDCVNLQTNDIAIMHELVQQQFSNLADSHQTILHQMGLPYKDSTFSEWTGHVSAVFRKHSDLKFGSDQWQRCISKTEQLFQLLSKLKEPAKNISKSFILLILHVVNRAWLIRQRASPSDYHGLLKIATFCLPLCQLDFLKSVNFCELMHDAYANAILMFGFNITNEMLKVERYYNQFTEIKTQLEEFFNQCLEFSINPRSEYVQDNLDKVTDDVELKWLAYQPKTSEGPTTTGSSKYQLTLTTDEYIEKIIKLCNRRLYSEITRVIAEAEDILQETGFKLRVGCHISGRYQNAFDSLSLPIDTFGNERSLFRHLRDQLIGLVTDCNEKLREMKIYSNDALAKWVELFFEFYSSDEFMYGSDIWQRMLTTGKTIVDDIPKGIDDNGRTIIQIYIQLIVILIKKAMVTCKRMKHTDYLGHLRLSSMYLTMIKSSLLNSKWYTHFRHDAYQRNVINLGLCIMNNVITADVDVYHRFDDMKRSLDKLAIDCQKLHISTGSPEDRDDVIRISKEVEKMFTVQKSQYDSPKNDGCIVSFTVTNGDVFELVSSAINSYRLREFVEMSVNLDDAETFDTCKIRLCFASSISHEFSQVLDFSNNIPESHGLEVVCNTTYANLDILAHDHAKVVAYMGDVESTVFRDLVDFLFTQKGIRPYTSDWDQLKQKACALVTYFESLNKEGQCVTKSYVLLFLTVLHNFMATRNRLRLTEHYKILPFMFACIPFCESKLIESDAWVKTRYDVYEISILKTGSALGAGQISYAHWFADHLSKLDELEERAKKLGIEACTQKEQLLQAKTIGKELWAGSLPRMCISAALYYYHYGCYKGMDAILKATDQTKDAKDIRMNFAMQLSNVFEMCVEEHNVIGEAKSPEILLAKARFVLELISEDHSNMLTQMSLKSNNCLQVWVHTLFGIIDTDNKQIKTFSSIAWKEIEKQSLLTASYITKLGVPGRCISQAYLSFFMTFCLNFIARRHQFIDDDFMTELQILLSIIKLCKHVFETSNFSVRVKSRACSLAASLFTQIKFDNSSLKELKQIVAMVKEYKELTQRYDEEILHKNDANYGDSNKENSQNESQEGINNNCGNSGESQETEQLKSKPSGKVKSEVPVVEACNEVDMAEEEVQSGAEKLFEELDKAGFRSHGHPATTHQGIILYQPYIGCLNLTNNL